MKFEKENRKRDYQSIGISVGVHGLLLLLFILFTAWTPQDPPPPPLVPGIELEFEASGMSPNANEETENTEQESQETQKEETSDVQTEQVDPNQDQNAKASPKPPVPDPNPKVDPKFTMTGGKKPGGKPNNNPGNTEGNGLENLAKGNGPSHNLKGWEWINRPDKRDPSPEKGFVLFKFTIDNEGKVINVKTSDTDLSYNVVEFYKKQLRATKFKYVGASDLPEDEEYTGYCRFNIKTE